MVYVPHSVDVCLYMNVAHMAYAQYLSACSSVIKMHTAQQRIPPFPCWWRKEWRGNQGRM